MDRRDRPASRDHRRTHARGRTLHDAIDLDEDVVTKSARRRPIPVIVLSDFDDDDDDGAPADAPIIGVNSSSSSSSSRGSNSSCRGNKGCSAPDRESETKPIVEDDAADDDEQLQQQLITGERLQTSPASIGDDTVGQHRAGTLSQVDAKPDIHQVGRETTGRCSPEPNYDIVRDIMESTGDYCGFTQQTSLYQICIFTSPTTPWYFGYIHEQPASFTLVFGCRDPARSDAAFLVNCLFIRGGFSALKLGTTRLIDQLISMNTLLRRCLAHFDFQFDDDDSARSKTKSFMEGVNTVIDFLSIDADRVPDNTDQTTATTRTWFVTRAPVSYSHAICSICGLAGPNANHYNMHERDIWSKLTLDQRDQVFDLASQRRRRIRSSIAVLSSNKTARR